jgi:hypothetical protein
MSYTHIEAWNFFPSQKTHMHTHTHTHEHTRMNIFVLYIFCSQDILCEYFQQTTQQLRNNEVWQTNLQNLLDKKTLIWEFAEMWQTKVMNMWKAMGFNLKTWEVNFTIIPCHMLNVVTNYKLQVHTYLWINLFIFIYLVVSRPSQANFWEKFASGPSEDLLVTMISTGQVINPFTQNFTTTSMF